MRLGKWVLQDVLGDHKGFINLDAEILHSDLIELLPKQQVDAGNFLKRSRLIAAVIARCQDLKAKGFSLALDDVVELSEDIKPLLGVVEVIQVGF
ncbi:MAG: hypothetical protein WDM70_11185 [Nitrosomonadales bacterium]